MRSCKSQGSRTRSCNSPGFVGNPRHAREDGLRLGTKPFANFREGGRMRAPVEQGDTEPCFEGPNSPAECGLRHGPICCSARKIAAGGQRLKVKEPRKIHTGALKAYKN